MKGSLPFLLVCLLLTACVSHDPSLSVALPLPRPPSEPIPEGLSLEDAVRLALTHNPDLQLRAIEPLIAGTFLAREQARFAPEVFAEVSRREARSSETARATGEQFNAEVEQTRISGGVQQTLPTGTEITLSARQLAESSNRAPDQEEARLALSLTQALLQGGGRSSLLTVERARRGIDLSQAEFAGFVEALVTEVELAYWQFWLAEQAIAITRQAMEVAEIQLSELRSRIEVGQLPRNEEAVALAELSRRRQDYVDATANLERRRLDLLGLLKPGEHLARFRATALPDLPEADLAESLELRTRLALTHRADLREARLRREQRQLDTQLTRNGLLPRLDFFAELAKTGFGPDRSAAWSDIDGDSYDVQAGLRFSRSLGERAEDSRHAEARFREEQADLALRNLESRIELELKLALNELDRALRQVELSQDTRRFQQLTVEAEVERFNAGAGTALQVAQAQRDLLSALIAEQRARVQARSAYLNLLRSEGTLLDRRGITP